MSAGAKSHATNNIGKTASQMAAFVGMCSLLLFSQLKCINVVNVHRYKFRSIMKVL